MQPAPPSPEPSKESPRTIDSIEARELIALVYEDLRRFAECRLAEEWSYEALSASDLVHEAFLRLADGSDVEWQNKSHFTALCRRALRRILVDRARYRGRAKRGGNRRRVDLDPQELAAGELPVEELLAIADALERLALVDARQAQVVEYRFFAGLEVQEVAEILGVSIRTVHRDWIQARDWLRVELTRAGFSSPP